VHVSVMKRAGQNVGQPVRSIICETVRSVIESEGLCDASFDEKLETRSAV
jgi:hypothetical protein